MTDRHRRSTPSGPRVAIVADYLNQRGGAEWVVAILHTMFPQAPVFTPILDRASLWPQLVDADIRVSWMQRLPGLRRHFRKYFALYPVAVEGFDVSRASSRDGLAKYLVTRPCGELGGEVGGGEDLSVVRLITCGLLRRRGLAES